MDLINIIDAKLNEIELKIINENKNIKLARRQCDELCKNLVKSKSSK